MLITLNETVKLIEAGKLLHIAGDESLLSKLPRGRWIGGTTPYFICNDGGVFTKDKLFVNEIDCAKNIRICTYDSGAVMELAKDAFENGVSFMILPFASECTRIYSKESPSHIELLMSPVIGWISGFDLNTGGAAKVFDGTTARGYTDRAVVLHVMLPENKCVNLGIINIFEASNMPIIEFPSDSLDVTDCLVNGKHQNFCEFLIRNEIDTKMPLVADYNGVLVNVSVKEIDEAKRSVSLYAPVFAGERYSFAKKLSDYAGSFAAQMGEFKGRDMLFSCNCILNYLYGELEGKGTPPFEGPVTFGEIAYQLLNQTLVYAEICDI